VKKEVCLACSGKDDEVVLVGMMVVSVEMMNFGGGGSIERLKVEAYWFGRFHWKESSLLCFCNLLKSNVEDEF
jgi:hypothetical protein